MADERGRCPPCRAVLVLGILVSLVSASLATGESPVISLDPSSPATADLAAAETVAFAVRLDAGTTWRLAVQQLGIDVAVVVEDGRGRAVLTVDRPLDRDGIEHALLIAETGGRYRITVRSLATTAPAGRVRVTLEPLDPSTPGGRAEGAETEAAEAYASGGAGDRRRALEGYRRALPLWESAGEALRSALAGYSIGVLHRLLGEPREALARATQAEARFSELGESQWRASALNEIGLAQVALGELVAARDSFESALGLLETAPDPFRLAIAQSNVCLTDLHLGALRDGVECYRRAAPLYRAAGDPQSEAMASTNSGRAHDILGEPDRALDSYQRALDIQRASGDRRGEALTLNNLAVLHAGRGDLERALTLYGEAADIYRSLDEKAPLALTLSNTGNTYWSLGETSRARSFFERALVLQRRAGDRRGEALTLTNLGRLADEDGQPDRARSSFERALALRRKIGNRRGVGRSLFDLGEHLSSSGDAVAALDPLGQALSIARGVEDREGEARALALIGDTLALAGDDRGAEQSLTAALAGFRAIGGTAGEAKVLISMARLARQRGSLTEAHQRVVAGLELIESLRARISTLELRASYLGRRRLAYELEIAILMDLHRAEPGRGYDALALASSERARARSLLELLGESGADLRSAVAPELLRGRQRLLHRLDAAEKARRKLVAGHDPPQEIAARERALEAILAELDLVETEIRSFDPARSALVQPPVLGASEIQRLLEPGTVLLVYSLAAEQSLLWWVETDSIEVFELPPEAAIVAAAQRAYEGISILDPAAARGAAADRAVLSEMILGPIAGRLGTERLVVVPDGVLHYLPFAALPSPESIGGPATESLLSRHEIVYLSSASSLALQRRVLAGRAPAPRRALVLADPVFSAADPRVAPADPIRSVEDDQLEDFARLRGTLREAEAIASLAAPGEVLVATGFDASRAALSEEATDRYGVVHFATHGLTNDRTPRLSRLVLSQVDREGRPVDGFLRPHDVYGLPLRADLVVLSGCRTGLGQEIRGEGLVGLTRAFQHAGARRVMASLWRVQERATAVLMERFYRALWVDGLEPAAALRSAQLSVAGERGWRDPYYWAGFVVQGDWRAAGG